MESLIAKHGIAQLALELDEVDFRILSLLQRDGRASLKQLAKEANVSVPTARFRLLRLKQLGVIKRFTAAIDVQRLAGGLTAFITLKAKLPDVSAAAQALREMEEVSEAYLTTGEHDLIVRVVVPDMRGLEEFVLRKLSRIPGVETYRSSFLIEPVKEQYGPTLRPGFGVKLECHQCGKVISGEMIRQVIDGREHYFCCQTCASTFRAARGAVEAAAPHV